MRYLIRGTMAVAALVLLLTAAPAGATDLSEQISSELTGPPNDVPGAVASIAAPVGNETQVATADVVRLTMAPPPAEPLKGLLTPDGSLPFATTTNAKLVLWDLAAIEAAKHAKAAGADVDALSIAHQLPLLEGLTGPDLVLELPALPAASPPASMGTDTVRAAVSDRLPVWAKRATVAVEEDPSGERVVTVSADYPREAFRALPIPTLADTLARAQIEMTTEGANVGRVIVWITDSVNGDPLFVAGADVLYGYRLKWVSPFVLGLISGTLTPHTGVAPDTGLDPDTYDGP